MRFVKDVTDAELASNLRKSIHGRKPCPFMVRILEQTEGTNRLRIDCDTEDEASYTYKIVYEHNAIAGNRYRVAKSKKSVYIVTKEATNA